MLKIILCVAISLAFVTFVEAKHWTMQEGIDIGPQVCPLPIEATYHGNDVKLLKQAIEALKRQQDCIGTLAYCISHSPSESTDISDVRKCFDDEWSKYIMKK